MAFSLSPHGIVARPSRESPAGFLIEEVQTSPYARFLLREWHTIFVDAQARLAAAGVVPSQRFPVLREISARYRGALRESIRRLREEGGDAEEGREMETVLALWHLAEVPSLHGAAGCGSSPSLATLEWLRANFWEPVGDAEMARVVTALRAPVGGDARAAEDGWRLAAQLALQGEPADAGQLLLLVAAKLRDREFAQLAQLLIDYPALSEAHAGGGGGGGGAWDAWRAGAANFRRWVKTFPHSTLRGGAERPAEHPGAAIGAALLDVLCGSAGDWDADCVAPAGARGGGGLRALAALPGFEGYDSWHYAYAARLLFGRGGVPLRAHDCGSLSAALRCALDAAGVALPAAEDRLSALSGGGGGEGVTAAVLLAVFLRVLGGEATAPLALCGGAYHAPWAAPHLADVLWHAGALAAPATAGGWPGAGAGAALRPALLLAHAGALRGYAPELGREALTYALAATPAAALAAAGLREADVAAGLPGAQHAPLSFPGLVARGGEEDGRCGALASAAARAGALAVLSGASPTAADAAEALAAALPVRCEAEAAAAVAAARALGLPRAARALAARWLRRALAAPSEECGGLGAALSWALGRVGGGEDADGALLAAAAAALGALLRESLSAALAAAEGARSPAAALLALGRALRGAEAAREGGGGGGGARGAASPQLLAFDRALSAVGHAGAPEAEAEGAEAGGRRGGAPPPPPPTALSRALSDAECVRAGARREPRLAWALRARQALLFASRLAAEGDAEAAAGGVAGWFLRAVAGAQQPPSQCLPLALAGAAELLAPHRAAAAGGGVEGEALLWRLLTVLLRGAVAVAAELRGGGAGASAGEDAEGARARLARALRVVGGALEGEQARAAGALERAAAGELPAPGERAARDGAGRPFFVALAALAAQAALDLGGS